MPIWFIFTKGDTISNITTEELLSRVPALHDAAKQQKIKGNLFERKIYKKGGFVRPYKTQALGKWPDEDTLTLDFEPMNLVEPIEEMFDSKSKHTKLFFGVAAFGVVVIAAGVFTLSYWLDKTHWEKTRAKASELLDEGHYIEAITVLNEYKPPFTSSILPVVLCNLGWVFYFVMRYSNAMKPPYTIR